MTANNKRDRAIKALRELGMPVRDVAEAYSLSNGRVFRIANGAPRWPYVPKVTRLSDADFDRRSNLIRLGRAVGKSWGQIAETISDAEGDSISMISVYQWARSHCSDARKKGKVGRAKQAASQSGEKPRGQHLRARQRSRADL